MEVTRGDIWWTELPIPGGSEPGYRRPVLVIQSDDFNRSRLPTVIVLMLSTTMRLLDMPGNVLVPRRTAGLPRDSVALVTQVATLDRDRLHTRAGSVPAGVMREVERGLKLVLEL